VLLRLFYFQAAHTHKKLRCQQMIDKLHWDCRSKVVPSVRLISLHQLLVVVVAVAVAVSGE